MEDGFTMEEERLDAALRAIILQYGFERVERTLRRIHSSFLARAKNEPLSGHRPEPKAKTVRPPRPKVTAPAYVSKLQIPADMHPLLAELAQRFDDRTFLPTMGDIRNFCLIYGIDQPASTSRMSAIPRIFERLSQLTPAEIQSMLRANSFSGPSRLGPIADAIRRSSRQRGQLVPTAPRSTEALREMSEAEREESSKPPLPSKI